MSDEEYEAMVKERKERCRDCDCYDKDDDWCEAYGNLCYDITVCKPFSMED